MNLLRKLIPDFLKQLDLDLQRDHPRLWSTRFHYHLWFLLLVNALIFLLGCIIQVSTLKFPDPENLFGYMIVPALVYFAFWTYKVVLFTVERRFGIRKPYAEVWEFLIHFVSIALILTIPYNLMLTAAYRIGHLVSDEEFTHEVDALNDQAYLFINGSGYAFEEEYAYESYRHASSTHHYFRNLEEYIHRDVVAMDEERSLHAIYDEYLDAYNQIADPEDSDYDPEAAKWHRAKVDSIEQRFPLFFVEHGRFTPRTYSDERNWLPYRNDSLLEIDYVERMRSGVPPDRERITAVLAIGRKYTLEVDPRQVDDVVVQYNTRKNSTSELGSASSQLQRIWKAKSYSYDAVSEVEVFYVLAILCFMLALLLSIFKNIYWQPFLITLVTSALLPILILIFAMLTEDDIIPLDDDVIIMYSYYWIAVFVIVMLGFVLQLKTYRTTRAVMLILANVAVPFIAIFTLGILHDRWDVFGQDALQNKLYALQERDGLSADVEGLQLQVRLLGEKITRIMQFVLWGGLVVYIVVLHPLFRNLYTRLMALPERK